MLERQTEIQMGSVLVLVDETAPYAVFISFGSWNVGDGLVKPISVPI